jgi:hypothetical protein
VCEKKRKLFIFNAMVFYGMTARRSRPDYAQ